MPPTKDDDDSTRCSTSSPRFYFQPRRMRSLMAMAAMENNLMHLKELTSCLVRQVKPKLSNPTSRSSVYIAIASLAKEMAAPKSMPKPAPKPPPKPDEAEKDSPESDSDSKSPTA